MTINEMKMIKSEKMLSYEMIAKGSELSISTVQKIFGGFSERQRASTLKRLEEYFERLSGNHTTALNESGPAYGNTKSCGRTMIIELPKSRDELDISKYPVLLGKQQGEFTEADRSLLPEGVRCELIFGVLYDMAAPTGIHQSILLMIAASLHNQLREKKKKCKVFVSPYDLKLGNDKNVVQPDIMLFCDKERTGENSSPVPDFIVEIISPSSRERDTVEKTFLYKSFGVKEYWTVDYKNKKVLVYYLNSSDTEREMIKAYSFSDVVPLAISDSELKIDFSEIEEYVTSLPEELK